MKKYEETKVKISEESGHFFSRPSAGNSLFKYKIRGPLLNTSFLTMSRRILKSFSTVPSNMWVPDTYFSNVLGQKSISFYSPGRNEQHVRHAEYAEHAEYARHAEYAEYAEYAGHGDEQLQQQPGKDM